MRRVLFCVFCFFFFRTIRLYAFFMGGRLYRFRISDCSRISANVIWFGWLVIVTGLFLTFDVFLLLCPKQFWTNCLIFAAQSFAYLMTIIVTWCILGCIMGSS